MEKGIYAASSGGLLESLRLQMIAHNLANSETVGFKAERLVSRQQEFKDTLVGQLESSSDFAKADQARTPGVVSVASMTDFSPGPVQFTGNALNVALANENTFFVVQTPQGEQLTRAGNFTLNQNGQLVTSDGLPVMGEGGPITVGEGMPLITSAGVVESGGEARGRLRVVEVKDPQKLKREGGVRFSGATDTTNVAADLIPGSVEMANSAVVESMVGLIATQRSFEAYTKVAKTIDEINDTAVRTARTTG